MAKYTDITILLDRSGSMLSIKHAMESGFDEFLNKHREVPSTRLSLIQFDGENPYDVVYIERPITDAPKLDLQPRGMTPLRDALCRVIDETGRRLRDKREADRPDQVLFLVITDGLENASRKHSSEDVRRRVKHQADRYSWEFVYLGANQDAIVEGEKLGFDLSKTITFMATPTATMDSWAALTSNTMNYAKSTIRGKDASASLVWTDDQRKKATDLDNTGGTHTVTNGKS